MINKLELLIGFGLVNALLIVIANWLRPDNYVIGNANLLPVLGAIVSGLVLGLILTVSASVKQWLDLFNDEMSNLKQTLIYYWIISFLSVWIVTRWAGSLGFGISKFYWAAILAVPMVFVNWLVWVTLKPSSESVFDNDNDED